MGNRSEAIRHILATVFSAQNALRELAPEYRWTGLGNLLGDYGEFVAIDHYGLTKAGAGASGFDATTPDGRTVQIKANHASQTIGIRGEADLLLVVRVEADGSWEELSLRRLPGGTVPGVLEQQGPQTLHQRQSTQVTGSEDPESGGRDSWAGVL